MYGIVDEHRAAHGVEPICAVLQIAPSAYRRHAARRQGHAPFSAREQRDAALMPVVEQVWNANLQVYGADKVWKQMNRDGVEVARCTVERLMRRLGLRGVRRGKVVRTTISDHKAPCPLDKVNRQFRANRPNQLWVSDLRVRLDLARLAVRGLRHRCLRPPRRRLVRQQFDANRLRSGCSRAGPVRTPTRARQQLDSSLGPRFATQVQLVVATLRTLSAFEPAWFTRGRSGLRFNFLFIYSGPCQARRRRPRLRPVVRFQPLMRGAPMASALRSGQCPVLACRDIYRAQ